MTAPFKNRIIFYIRMPQLCHNTSKSNFYLPWHTRGKSNFYLPRVRRNYGKQRLLYQGIAEWNTLDKSILEDRNILTRFYPVIFIEHLNIVFFKLFITISNFTLFFYQGLTE